MINGGNRNRHPQNGGNLRGIGSHPRLIFADNRDRHIEHRFLQGIAETQGLPLFPGKGLDDLRSPLVVFHGFRPLVRVGQNLAGPIDHGDSGRRFPAYPDAEAAQFLKTGLVQ